MFFLNAVSNKEVPKTLNLRPLFFVLLGEKSPNSVPRFGNNCKLLFLFLIKEGSSFNSILLMFKDD